MKACNRCGDLKSDEEFSVDRSREDGLALICRECNKEKSKEWYRENRRRKIESTQEYKRLHPEHGASPPRPIVRERRQEKRAKQEADAPGDVQVIRFSASEWEFCTEQGALLGMRPGEFVRLLVRDKRSAVERIIADRGQDEADQRSVVWPTDPIRE